MLLTDVFSLFEQGEIGQSAGGEWLTFSRFIHDVFSFLYIGNDAIAQFWLSASICRGRLTFSRFSDARPYASLRVFWADKGSFADFFSFLTIWKCVALCKAFYAIFSFFH